MCKRKTMKQIIERIAEYRNTDEAESMLLLEIAKQDNKAAWAWIVLAVVKLEEKQYMSFGTCLKNALENGSIDDMLPEITEVVEHLEPYLENTFENISDFLDGYKADSST